MLCWPNKKFFFICKEHLSAYKKLNKNRNTHTHTSIQLTTHAINIGYEFRDVNNMIFLKPTSYKVNIVNM